MIPEVLGPHSVATSGSPSYSMTGKSKLGRFDEDLHKVICGLNSCFVVRLCNIITTMDNLVTHLAFKPNKPIHYHNLYILMFCQPVFTSRYICVCATSVSCLMPSPTVPDSAILTHIYIYRMDL